MPPPPLPPVNVDACNELESSEERQLPYTTSLGNLVPELEHDTEDSDVQEIKIEKENKENKNNLINKVLESHKKTRAPRTMCVFRNWASVFGHVVLDNRKANEKWKLKSVPPQDLLIDKNL